MKLSAPKVNTWWIAVILGVLGLLGQMAILPDLGAYAFWLVIAGFVVMALGTLMKDF